MNSLSKAEWRAHVLRERRAVSSGTRAAEARALAATAVSVAGSTAPAGATVVRVRACRLGTRFHRDARRAACGRLRVLLPVTGEPGPLEWAEFTGAEGLAAAGHGLQEPFGPVLPAGEVASASVIFVPALAVDERGTRLGRGAGFYDRTLGYADPGAALVAVVRDCELVPTLPADPHDVRMHYALTPGRGLVRLRDE
ncbi:5-formyltetrahydrofolate cyclo-ligase [Rhodococcus hoagii]|nr:5-formyltetrahydrofolate cyclo-ligase [Prescottella equi]